MRANSKNKTKGTQIRKEIVYSRTLTWLLEIGWAGGLTEKSKIIKIAITSTQKPCVSVSYCPNNAEK